MRKNVQVKDVNEDRSTKGGMMNYYILRRPKMSFGEIASKVVEKFPDAETKSNTVATYSYNLKKRGIKVPQRKRGRIAGSTTKASPLKEVNSTKATTVPAQTQSAELTAVIRKQNKIFEMLANILTNVETKLAQPVPPAAPKAKSRSKSRSRPRTKVKTTTAPEGPKQEAEGPKQEAAVA